MTRPLIKAAWIAGAILLALPGGNSFAQDDREQRIKELENRIEEVEAKLWINRVESTVDRTPSCTEHKAKAKAYYDQAVALNEQYRGHATPEYQQQINDAKARNQEEIGLYKRCFEAAIAGSGESYGGVRTYNQFNELAFTLGKRLADAPKDLQTYLADLKAELQKLLKGTEGYVGRLDAISGAVTVSRGTGPFQPAGEGTKLFVGDVLRTGPNALARVVLPDDVVCPSGANCGFVTIDVSGDTEIRVGELVIPPPPEKSAIQATIDLIRGALRAVTNGWGQGSIFNVRAGTSQCGIRGTDIAMRYEPGEDRVEYLLKTGTVEIKTAGSGTKVLNAGEALKVEHGTAAPVQPLTDASWSAAMAAIGSQGAAAGARQPVPASPAAPATPVAPAGPRFGAIAYSRSTGIGAMTKQGASQEDAQKRVLDECREGSKAGDCRLLIWFKNGCGAFARQEGDFGPYGADWAKSQADADAKAMAICAQYGGQNCKVIAQFCTQ